MKHKKPKRRDNAVIAHLRGEICLRERRHNAKGKFNRNKDRKHRGEKHGE